MEVISTMTVVWQSTLTMIFSVMKGWKALDSIIWSKININSSNIIMIIMPALLMINRDAKWHHVGIQEESQFYSKLMKI